MNDGLQFLKSETVRAEGKQLGIGESNYSWSEAWDESLERQHANYAKCRLLYPELFSIPSDPNELIATRRSIYKLGSEILAAELRLAQILSSGAPHNEPSDYRDWLTCLVPSNEEIIEGATNNKQAIVSWSCLSGIAASNADLRRSLTLIGKNKLFREFASVRDIHKVEAFLSARRVVSVQDDSLYDSRVSGRSSNISYLLSERSELWGHALGALIAATQLDSFILGQGLQKLQAFKQCSDSRLIARLAFSKVECDSSTSELISIASSICRADLDSEISISEGAIIWLQANADSRNSNH